MDMTMSSIRPNRVEVVTSVQRRRRWTPEQKLEIVKQTNELVIFIFCYVDSRI
jgi:transposase